MSAQDIRVKLIAASQAHEAAYVALRADPTSAEKLGAARDSERTLNALRGALREAERKEAEARR